jgi:hypothetical protein
MPDDWNSPGPWMGSDGFAHPSSPAGGGGPGHFRTPGPLGLTDGTSSLPHPQGPATRYIDPSSLSRLHEQRGLSAWLGRILAAPDWTQLKSVAEFVLGPQSFSAGVCVGIVKNPVTSVVALLELQKVFILADLHDRLEHPQSWSALLPSFIPGQQPIALGARGLLALGFLEREDLLAAHRQRTEMLGELREILANPAEFLTGLPGKLVHDYEDKFRRYSALRAKTDLVSQFQAGEILGDLLMDVLTTIAGIASGVGTVAKLAVKAPQLMKAARLFRGGRRAGGAAQTPGAADAAGTASGRASIPTASGSPSSVVAAAEPPKPRLAPPPTKPVRPKAPPTTKGPPKLPGVTAQDRALAAAPGSSPAQIRARQKLTKTFLEEYGREWQGPPPGHFVKMDETEVLSQMKGHDFTKPIIAGPPPPVGPNGAGTLYQWQRLNGGQGQYYADAMSKPESLGIASQASDGSGNVVSKIQVKYTADPEAPYLQSTAAPATDTWSIRGQEIATPGGDTQWVVGERTMVTK